MTNLDPSWKYLPADVSLTVLMGALKVQSQSWAPVPLITMDILPSTATCGNERILGPFSYSSTNLYFLLWHGTATLPHTSYLSTKMIQCTLSSTWACVPRLPPPIPQHHFVIHPRLALAHHRLRSPQAMRRTPRRHRRRYNNGPFKVSIQTTSPPLRSCRRERLGVPECRSSPQPTKNVPPLAHLHI